MRGTVSECPCDFILCLSSAHPTSKTVPLNKEKENPRPAVEVKPPKGGAIFLCLVRNIDVDIGRRFASVRSSRKSMSVKLCAEHDIGNSRSDIGTGSFFVHPVWDEVCSKRKMNKHLGSFERYFHLQSAGFPFLY